MAQRAPAPGVIARRPSVGHAAAFVIGAIVTTHTKHADQARQAIIGERLHLASLDAGLQCVMPLVSSFGQPSPRTPSTPTSTTSKHTRLQTMRAGEGKGTEGVNREGNERCNESSEMEQSTAASAPYMSANRCLVAPTTI